MSKSFHIIGISGNMGQRYKAILEYLGYDVTGSDKRLPYMPDTLRDNMNKAYGFIIATPTHTHLDEIKKLFYRGKPILCEKPLCKSVKELDEFENQHRPDIALLRMINQYEHMPRGYRGPTCYNYFKSGADGLAWDCLNIFGLSTQTPVINNKSPIWICQLNGKLLNIQGMDHAYISMMDQWTTDPRSNYAYARRAHEKVEDYLKEKEKNG